MRITFNHHRFTHAYPLVKTLNGLNFYQLNLLLVHLFMHKIKTKSFSYISQHDFRTINHKHATRYSRKIFKELKKETNYAKYCICAHGPFIWNGSLSKTENSHIIEKFYLNVKSKKRNLYLKNN